jgi:hypothetical protein
MVVVISTIPIKTVSAECGIWTSQPQIVTILHDKNTLSRKKIESCTNETAKKDVCKMISKHNIVNVFMHKDIPLSNQEHGIYRMTPP